MGTEAESSIRLASAARALPSADSFTRSQQRVQRSDPGRRRDRRAGYPPHRDRRSYCPLRGGGGLSLIRRASLPSLAVYGSARCLPRGALRPTGCPAARRATAPVRDAVCERAGRCSYGSQHERGRRRRPGHSTRARGSPIARADPRDPADALLRARSPRRDSELELSAVAHERQSVEAGSRRPRCARRPRTTGADAATGSSVPR